MVGLRSCNYGVGHALTVNDKALTADGYAVAWHQTKLSKILPGVYTFIPTVPVRNRYAGHAPSR